MSDQVEQLNAERVAQAACLRLLRASAGLTSFSGLACLACVFTLLIGTLGGAAPRGGMGMVLMGMSFCAGLLVAYYGFRLRLDAELFALLDEPGPVDASGFAAGVDAFRAQLHGGPAVGPPSPLGPLGPRYAGALRLWRRWAAALGLQLALLAGAAGAACLAALAAA